MKNKEVISALKELKEDSELLKQSGKLNGFSVNITIQQDLLERLLKNIEILEKYFEFIKGKSVEIVYPWTDQRFLDKWELWKTYKRQQFRFIFKPIAEQSMLKKLHEISEGDMETAIALIQNAIDNTWHAIYPMKKMSKKPDTTYKNNIAQRLMR